MPSRLRRTIPAFLLLRVVCVAQAVPSLKTGQESLNGLIACSAKIEERARKTRDPKLQELATALSEDSRALEQGLAGAWWHKTDAWPRRPSSAEAWASIPHLYLDSLAAQAETCNSLLRRKRPIAADDLADIARDIHLKVADCRFAGTGRLVLVEVQTETKTGVKDSGWTVFYKFQAPRSEETPCPGKADNCARPLPAGLYSMRALKSEGAAVQRTNSILIPVGGSETAAATILVP